MLGSSVASSFKSSNQTTSWPYLLKESLPPELEIKVQIRSGLTFVRSIPELVGDSVVDLFIFHFGTAIGWPSSIVKQGIVMGVNFTSEFGFHQPAFKSANRRRWLRAWIKGLLRNSVKYVLFFTGQYKTRINRREIEDQINAVVVLAQKKSCRIIWIQHQALQHRSIFLERRSYQRYYKEILWALEKYKSNDFTVITLPDSFLKQETYLVDCVHLSEQGHREIYKIVREAFKNG